MRNLTNCFYCQNLGGLGNSPTYGKCAFCGARSNPLYSVIYQNKKEYVRFLNTQIYKLTNQRKFLNKQLAKLEAQLKDCRKELKKTEKWLKEK